MMKVLFCLLVVLAVFGASQCRIAPKFTERKSLRTPFYRRQQNLDPLIVGGDPALIEDFPHHLGLLDLNLGGYICGASNISPRFALSAAHCLEFETPANRINLWGGSTSRLARGTIFFVEDYILHPEYDIFTLENDVAVIIVDSDSLMQGVPHVSPIALPPNCASICCGVCPAGNKITVVGWGVYNVNTNRIPENLLQVSKAIVDLGECDRIWGGGITPRMFCTNVENGIDSCQGDSGGSIIRDGIQVGIVSFGSEICGDGSAPAVYARVEDPLIRDFIRQHTGI